MGERCVAVVTSRPVLDGEELLLDYGDDYWAALGTDAGVHQHNTRDEVGEWPLPSSPELESEDDSPQVQVALRGALV